MAMKIDKKNNVLIFDVPNSEASINAQHYGIADRTVGSYYMSDNFDECKTFLSDFEGEYCLDLLYSINNVEDVIKTIEEKRYNNFFKGNLEPQKKAIEALKWYVANNGNYYFISNPSVNENQKYLKLDNVDEVFNTFKTLIIGDLCSLNFKKIGKTGYIVYIDKNDNFPQVLDNENTYNWR